MHLPIKFLSGAGLACLIFSFDAFASESYTMNDYNRIEKIDVHTHIHNKNTSKFLTLLRKDNFKILTINVDYSDFPPLAQQETVAVNLHKTSPNYVAFAATFPVANFEQPEWLTDTIKHIDDMVSKGAVGIKIWKNIGMELRSPDGKMIMLDDKRFDPVFNHLAQKNIVLLNHIGEPKNCWLPVEQMTVLNDKEYFKNHPQYHMYLHPELPSYEQQMAARNAMLEKNPGLPFVGVHLASLEWSVDELAKFLDRFPSATVDLAARIGQLQYQSNRDREKVRQFFIRYQDRLMYGTDLSQSSEQSDADFNRDAHAVWLRDWRYFNTSQSMQVPELAEPVQGLALPKIVVDKLYSKNARKRFPTAWK
jgi:hypothetical protein